MYFILTLYTSSEGLFLLYLYFYYFVAYPGTSFLTTLIKPLIDWLIDEGNVEKELVKTNKSLYAHMCGKYCSSKALLQTEPDI